MKSPFKNLLLAGSISILFACTAQTDAKSSGSEIDPATILSTAEAMAAASDADWRDVDPNNIIYMELATGRVIMELAPGFAPNHVDNLRTLVQEHYFDSSAIVRSQENYVAQWSAGEDKPLGTAKPNLDPEWEMDWNAGLPFLELKDGDVYAPVAGISSGMPVAGDRKTGKVWLTHCYGMLGVGRGNELDSGNSAELYVVTGHAPRHLDKNVTLIGRVLRGMELLTTLPRGKGPLGFYEDESENVPIKSIKLAADLPAAEQTKLQVMKTDGEAYANFVRARRYRKEDWFNAPTGRIELCNVPIPVRDAP